MIDIINFTVWGNPQGKKRPRFARQGNYVRTYTDKETVSYENLVKLSFINGGCKKYVGEIPLKVEIDFYMSIPKSTSKKKYIKMLSNEIRPLKKIDLDNGIKIILDALNKVAFDDDKQVIEVSARKFYSDTPRTEVKICQMEKKLD